MNAETSTLGRTPRGGPQEARARALTLPDWWPLAALTLLAAVLRLSTLNLQSFWFDEAFTPVRVLHPSLFATLRGVVHTENTPPLWYVLEWVDARGPGRHRDDEASARKPAKEDHFQSVYLSFPKTRSARQSPFSGCAYADS